jgi:hypothetical protein
LEFDMSFHLYRPDEENREQHEHELGEDVNCSNGLPAPGLVRTITLTVVQELGWSAGYRYGCEGSDTPGYYQDNCDIAKDPGLPSSFHVSCKEPEHQGCDGTFGQCKGDNEKNLRCKSFLVRMSDFSNSELGCVYLASVLNRRRIEDFLRLPKSMLQS